MDGLHGPDLPVGSISPIYIIAIQMTSVALGEECFTPTHAEVR